MRRLFSWWGATLLALTSLLTGAPVAQATIAEAQTPCNGHGATTSAATCTLASNVTSGNLIVVVGSSQNNAPTNLGAVSGTGGCNGTFTSRGASYTDPVGIAFWTFTANSTASCAVTWSKGGTNEPATIIVYELSGWDGTTPIDSAAVFANGSGTSLTVAMNATSVAVDYLIGAIASSDTTNVTFTTVQSGWSTSVATSNPALLFATEKQITASAGAYTAGWSSISNAFTRVLKLGALGLTGVATTPTINSTTPATNVSNSASLTINGVLLKAAGNSTVTFGGASQTVTSQSSTAPVITVARSTNKYGIALNLILTDSNSVASNTFSGTGIIPQSGWSYVNLGTLVGSGNRITAIADLASGDQLAYDNKGGLVTVFNDGSFVADPTVVSFNVEAWSSSAWGTTALQTINGSSSSSNYNGWFMFAR